MVADGLTHHRLFISLGAAGTSCAPTIHTVFSTKYEKLLIIVRISPTFYIFGL
jgi:hypothetical protein